MVGQEPGIVELLPSAPFRSRVDFFSDAAKTGGWGAACRARITGGPWSTQVSVLDINMQELLATELEMTETETNERGLQG